METGVFWIKNSYQLSGPAERFLSHRDSTLMHLLKPPGLLSNRYFEAWENCQILKNRRD